MKKKSIIIASVIVLICIIYIVVLKLINYYKYVSIQKSIIMFLNNDEMSEYFEDKDLKIIHYIKSENNTYDITDFINYYIETVNKSVEAKINKKDEEYMFYFLNNYVEEIGYTEFEVISKNYEGITIHGLLSNASKFIIKNITDTDIKDYNNKMLDNELQKKLEKIFEHSTDNKWYINSNEDKHLELPYNVYIDYVSDKKKTINRISKFLDIEILKGELEKITEKERHININFIFQNVDGEIIKGSKSIGAKKDINGIIKINVDSFLPIYCLRGNTAYLKTGQHDYDKAREEELKKEAEEPYVELPHRNWDDYDENGNYIGETSSARFVTDEEFQDMMSKIRENNKKLGIEESTISREEAIERLNKIKKEAGIE